MRIRIIGSLPKTLFLGGHYEVAKAMEGPDMDITWRRSHPGGSSASWWVVSI